MSVLLMAAAVLAATNPLSPPITITAIPSEPYIEDRPHDRSISVDLIAHNSGAVPLRLVSIQESVYDDGDKLELKREINGNGSPSALAGLGDLVIAAGQYKDIFLPFEGYDTAMSLARIHLTLIWLNPSTPVPPVAITGDVIASLDLRPRRFHPIAYCLPLNGELLVHDGHDLTSHHRRRDLGRFFAGSAATAVNANLYAYDFVRVNDRGALYLGDPDQKEHWLSYGAIVLAPTAGEVIEAIDGIPDNTFVNGSAISSQEAQKRDPQGFGNHVLIKAADGRVSWLLHMESGTVSVKAGEHVEPRMPIGRVGFSGDSLFPHLHYTVTEGSRYPSQGVPSYFGSFRRIVGSKGSAVSYGQVDTGELIVSDAIGACGQ
jgi:hypothetical protein